MTHTPSPPLQHLVPGWFATVMGLCGLSLAWSRAVPAMGEAAGAIALGVGVLALGVFALLGVLSLLRQQHHPDAVAEDLRHPVRHAFVAAVPASVLLLATVATTLAGPSRLAQAVWMLGAVAHFGVTVWVMTRWLQGNREGGMVWAGITPVLFIPIVGNVLTPLAGVALGMPAWAAAQFGVGVVLWPVTLTLLVVRLGQIGMWPERMLASTFITIAPPSVIGLGLLQLGAPAPLGWALWGLGLFFLCWSASVLKRVLAQPFSIAFWGLSFPLAAFTALTLRLSEGASPAFGTLGLLLLALTSIVIAGLALGTVQGLRRGSLLVPEPAPANVAVPAG
ncbi:SLAC1 anion channel family protein [Hydrogenophaga sp. OTU3427]|uniref:SLAC1 anion channel family protein n=1 Tax=Hydrogenophaga sp. OTU3427 TaxID=3043856 RepID=UPI00313D5E57